MASRPGPSGLNDQEQFLEIVDLLGDAVREGNLRSRCMPNGKVVFSLGPDALSAIAKTAGVDKGEVATVVDEAGEIATVVLRGETNLYVQYKTSTPTPEGPESEEEQQERKKQVEESQKKAQTRIDTVTEKLITPRLRERFRSVMVAKHDVFASVDWEVAVRAYDADVGDEASGPALLVELKYGRPRTGSYMKETLRAFLSPEPEYERLAFQCDEEDLEELISTLDKARAKLAEHLKG